MVSLMQWLKFKRLNGLDLSLSFHQIILLKFTLIVLKNGVTNAS